MKKRLFQASTEYEKPQVELLSFSVERGFELSASDGTLDDMEEIPGSWA